MGVLLQSRTHFDSIIQVQSSIKVQRNTARELTLAKQRERRQAARTIDNDDAGYPISPDSDAGPSEETIVATLQNLLNSVPIVIGRVRCSLALLGLELFVNCAGFLVRSDISNVSIYSK